jgi:hypothetical protein
MRMPPMHMPASAGERGASKLECGADRTLAEIEPHVEALRRRKCDERLRSRPFEQPPSPPSTVIGVPSLQPSL